MDKAMMKRALVAAGIPVAAWREHRDGDDPEATCDAAIAELGGRDVDVGCFIEVANCPVCHQRLKMVAEDFYQGSDVECRLQSHDQLQALVSVDLRVHGHGFRGKF